MKLKRLLLATSVTLVSALAAAGLSDQSVAQTLERIKETKTLRIGHRADARPFSYLDEAGKPTGYVVELCQAIAQGLQQQLDLPELAIEYHEVSTQNRFEAVASGRIDLLCGASTATLARREIVSFSLPTFITGVSAALRQDETSFLKEVLAGRRPTAPSRTLVTEAFRDRVFGVRSGSTAEPWLEENIASLAAKAKVVKVDDYAKGLDLLAAGEIDAFFGDRAILLELILQKQLVGTLELGERHLTYEPYALALARGDEDFRLAVDRELNKLYSTEAIEALFAKYFGRPSESLNSLLLLTRSFF